MLSLAGARSLNAEEHERAEASNYNFDHPSAFSFDRVLDALLKIRAGAEVTEVPCYDYVTHSVMGPEHNSKIVKPSIVILEGILAFHDPAVRALLDMKVFVDTDADTRLARRIRRDISERGRDLDGVLTQYERFVKPSFDAFCLPQRSHADVILPRGKENTVAIAMVVENLRTMLVEYECEVAEAQLAADKKAAASRQMASPEPAALLDEKPTNGIKPLV
jgi:uridine kinase